MDCLRRCEHGWFRGEILCGRVQALLREVVFGIFIKLFESVNAFSTNSDDKVAGALLEYLAWHNILFGSLQTDCLYCACFHFLEVVIRP